MVAWPSDAHPALFEERFCARISWEGGARECTYVCTFVQSLCIFVRTYVHKNSLLCPISGTVWVDRPAAY